MTHSFFFVLTIPVFLISASPSTFAQGKNVKDLCKDANASSEQIEVQTDLLKLYSRNAQVLTQGGSPVVDAPIGIVLRDGQQMAWSGKTDSNGQFLIPALASGRYELTICKSGYNTAVFSIKIPKSFKSRDAAIFRVNPS